MRHAVRHGSEDRVRVDDGGVAAERAGAREPQEALPSRSRAWLVRHWSTLLLPPLLAFLAGNALLWIAAHQAGFNYFDPGSWGRWDSGQYMRIATQGYMINRCPAGRLYPPGSWCGDTAWLPLYPWLLKLLNGAGMSLLAAGVLLSSLFHLAALGLLWSLLGARLTLSALLCLALAAVFPGSVYFHAVFPVSMALCLALLCLLLLVRRCWTAAGVAGALAAASYSTGVLLAPIAAVWILVTQRKRPLWRPALRLARVCALIVAGFLFVLAVQWLQTRMWGAYFRDQAKYYARYQNPLRTLSDALVKPARADAAERLLPAIQRNLSNRLPIVKAHLVLATLVEALGLGVAAARRRASDADLAGVITAVVLWVVPLIAVGGLSLYRSMVMLVPGVIPLRRLPAVVLVPLVVAAGYISYGMVPHFLEKGFH